MTVDLPTQDSPFTRLGNRSGLSFELLHQAAVRRIYCGSVVLNQYTGNELEGSLCQLYLRTHEAGRIAAFTPLLGPQSPAAFVCDESGWHGQGFWQGIAFSLRLQLAADETAWFWHIRLSNTLPHPQTLDILHTQDVGLAQYGSLRLNEYYVSQYVDCTPLWHESHGWTLAFRQNQPVDGRYPWLMLGSLGHAGGYATDALQVHGLAARSGQSPRMLYTLDCPNQRLQHEHTLALLAERPVTVPAGATWQGGFLGCYRADHPEASHPADQAWAEHTLALPEACPKEYSAGAGLAPVATRFSPVSVLASLDLDEPELHRLFGSDWHAIERDQNQLLSFFTGTETHVVLKTKELGVLRPHGHILRTGSGLTPDEAALTSTVWMGGVFNALLTQGHVSINRWLSTTRSYLSLFRAHGQRVFIKLDQAYHLLDLPSAFAMTPNACHWYYRWSGGLLVVSNRAGWATHALDLSLEIMEGTPRAFLLCQSVALNGDDGAWPGPVAFEREGAGLVFRTKPHTELGQRFPNGSFRMDFAPSTPILDVRGDELLFEDGRSRQQPWVCVAIGPTRRVDCRITGQLVSGSPLPAENENSATAFYQAHAARFSGISEPTTARRLTALQAIQPWLTHNALIHYLSPRGLEQFSGGGWGVRDVTQGPVELLLAAGHTAPVREVLLRVFAAQNPDGDWPQWFMFFERERHIRPGDSHGDIVFWPVLATARYLLASGDGSFLEASVPFHHPSGPDQAEHASIATHIERAFSLMAERRIPNTRLAAYGHGDWNDSLQPVDPTMREQLCSTWTVTLHYQTLTTLAEAYHRLGQPDLALPLEADAARIRADFRRYLLVDGLLAGFAWFADTDHIDYLVHPRDTRTGLRYSVLPMIHAVLTDLLTADEVSTHLALIERSLSGPDGVRLFDRPSPYRGGPQQFFQRAESAAYFGREIGLMYTHAHLRYAEALAHVGRADDFFKALCLAVPIDVQEQIQSARPRQANCYYSSSDAAFADRYEASAEYERIARGEVALEGGWRIYSSGAGIACRLIRECWLGLRQECDRIIIDPVMPSRLDGLEVELMWNAQALHLCYRVGVQGYAPERLELNGMTLAFCRLSHPYRNGGVWLTRAEMDTHLKPGQQNRLVITLA